MSDTFKSRLQIAVEKSRLSQSEISRRAKVSKSSLSAWLKGEYEAKQDSVFRLANVLDVSEGWLMGLTDDPFPINRSAHQEIDLQKNSRKLPIINVSAGLPETDNDDVYTIEVPNYYEEDFNKNNLFAIKVIGESMNKVLPNNSFVICKKAQDRDEIKNGDYVVYKKDNGYCIKKFFETDTLLIFEHMSYDDSFETKVYNKSDLEDLDVLEIIGVVVYQFNRFH